MEVNAINILQYRRQYVIAPTEIECPFLYNAVNLNNGYLLYVHIDLTITEYSKNDSRIILLGDIFDFEPQIKSNNDILKELLLYSFSEIIERIARYTGRYVIIYQHDKELKLLHDSIASRKIFYANINGSWWFASQPYLLGRILKLKETTITSKIAYYNSSDFIKLEGANIGDTTIYDEIHQLLPNHYLDINHTKPIRYFPNKPFLAMTVSETEKKCSEIIKGYMENIIARFDVMLPVTAGKDSRLLLAASKDSKEKVYYYINKDRNMGVKSKDIYVPNSLLEKLGMDFHIIDPYISINEEFKKIYFENNKRSTTNYLPMIYNYYINYSDRINLPGNVAFDPYFILTYPNVEITPSLLAEICHVIKYDFAKDYYSEWLSNSWELCKRANLNILNLFYWEERIANWGTQTQINKDIAQEEINPFNSRLLTSLFLSIDCKLLFPPNFAFHKKTIKYLWPEVLQMPINPSIKSKIRHILQGIGIYPIVLNLKRKGMKIVLDNYFAKLKKSCVI